MKPNKRILVLTPHADDETLGMWWTIAKMVDQWYEVLVVLFCLTDFNYDIRLKEFTQACSILWCKYIDYPLFWNNDMKLYKIDYSEIVTKIDNLIIDYKPDILFIPEDSPHQDHHTVYKAAITALRISLQRDYNVPEVYSYDYPPLTRNVEWKVFNIIVDITDYIDKKKAAFYQYESQRNDKTWANAEWIIDYWKSCWFGRGYKYAEKFNMLRKLTDF